MTISPLIEKAARGISTFFGGLSTKVILILIVLAIFLFDSLYWYRHGITVGARDVTNSYNERAQKEIKKQEDRNDKNAQDAIKQEKDLSSKLTALELSKKALEDQLEYIKQHNKNVPSNSGSKSNEKTVAIPSSSCDKPDPARVRDLKATISKANS